MGRITPLVYMNVSQDELTYLLKDKPKCKYCSKAIWYENIKVWEYDIKHNKEQVILNIIKQIKKRIEYVSKNK